MKALKINHLSHWQSSFTFNHVKCLIVCRGPIRLESIKIFKELNMSFGILLSEKDSMVFPDTLAPELRCFDNRKYHVHHITEYMGDTKDSKELCIEQIIKICKENDYTHIFAGYGFMAEDYKFVSKIEKANLRFIGPNSNLIRQAGSKDEAKKLARELNVSVIPGEEFISALTLISKAGKNTIEFLREQVKKHKLVIPENWESFGKIDQANAILEASYLKKIDLFSISELQKEAVKIVKKLFIKFPGNSIRFKHVLGGGGKGQRIISSVEEVQEAVLAVLIESKTNGVGENKNFIIELNIENSRHVEIQLIGNGKWCAELGGRDCSLQMHEQKLVEFSLTEEMLGASADEYENLGKNKQAEILRNDALQLKAMCLEAEKFGEALNLDSVSTFECIVDKKNHYFMEVNTRIQVEHRVTEMVYKLKFANPDDPNDFFYVNSLVAAMVLISCYGDILPRPVRINNSVSGIEARINSTNAALNPHSDGIILQWSEPGEQEIRDDQGIGIVNFSTGFSQPYKFSGAYDSNIALSVTRGISRKDSFEKLTEILRRMEVRGDDLNLNINFLYGILQWFIVNDTMLKPSTNFVSSYLALAGKIKVLSNLINFDVAWEYLIYEAKNKYGIIGEKICEQKLTLLLRPLKKLFNDTHLLMGWIVLQKNKYNKTTYAEIENPVKILKDLYHYLNLEKEAKKLPSDEIWEHDHKILERANTFYQNIELKFEDLNLPWSELNSLLCSKIPPFDIKFGKDNKAFWDTIVTAHKGHQAAMELLRLPIVIAGEASFFKLSGNDFLEIEIPHDILNINSKKDLISKLNTIFSSNSNNIIASSGGIFYARENPEKKDFVKEGQHVDKGQVLGLLEVMKMFNEIRAPFSGTIIKKCFENNSGILVAKKQILFLIKPDQINSTTTHEEKLLYQKKQTTVFMNKLFSK